MNNEQARRRIIAAALFPTHGLLSVTSHYEQLLTEHYVSGVLNADQAIALLEDYQRNQLTTCPIAFGTAPVAQGQPSLC